ncbi:2-oxo-4-hydroxy-4-carboxy-5-ureidoimidazoline decarboxylase [Paenibacillus sp. MMS18-CY102]|uniref:2-oxo-4-hydroxy-4-carboxy-5-ureidoimidazoline decarboxylase n=1 Tax=Paenibacillus sp. MMS18-CY102 TaxID=2682849 RepID=UPI0013657CBC|nr:2-oxo-4-hydroxy-4-carboxy-5-ureidoimidazoline decarboxylase [Paenibacillus sp. MMS18-CY102]MWC26840.1 2-oxo-4-hydroxy-4-carboxy-5-ureidoimidazoline decarboxylase [Paenibacillus sp. MMS18-CY102]
MKISQLNQLPKESFMEAVGWVVEHSPWVMERVFEERPFHNVEQMHAALKQVIASLDEEDKVKLLRSHPDLGSRLQMTDASVAEQNGAGLDRLTPAEYEQLVALNARYTAAFGFPFIMAVKGKSKPDIIEAMIRRVENGREDELDAAVAEIGRITGFRLRDRVQDENTTA